VTLSALREALVARGGTVAETLAPAAQDDAQLVAGA